MAMANLSVRRIDDATYHRLRLRAAEHGVSMEEEVRRILQRAMAAPERLGQLAIECFGPVHGVKLELPERTDHEPLRFD
jgi:plasmid stability protein